MEVLQANTASQGQTMPSQSADFCDGVTALVGQGGATDVIYLDSCKAFDMILLCILVSKLKCVFKGWIAWWMKNWSQPKDCDKWFCVQVEASDAS